MHAGFEGRHKVYHSNMDAKVPHRHYGPSINTLLDMSVSSYLNLSSFSFGSETDVSALFSAGHI